MVTFEGEPILEPHADGVNWTFARRFAAHDSILGDICIPEGFVTDLGSIPKIFQNLISPEGKPLRGYVLHDWLYAVQKCKRADADALLFRAFKAVGEKAWKRWVVYIALRLGGWGAWRHDFEKERRWRLGAHEESGNA